MRLLKYSKRFKKDLKAIKHDKDALDKLTIVLDYLSQDKALPDKNCNHALHGEFKGCFECHIRPDLLLIYQKHETETLILLLRIGSHNQLF